MTKPFTTTEYIDADGKVYAERERGRYPAVDKDADDRERK